MNPFPDPRQLLKRYGLAAKKSWGQNFLVSDRVYRAIVDATVRSEADWVLEFGAGLGTLTMRLAERLPEGKVVAVERDRELVEVLTRELGHFDNVEVVADNALTYDVAAIARWAGEPIAVCGNLPYNIGTRILMNVVTLGEHVRRAVFMVQKEVADRLVAVPGTKQYGALTVLVNRWMQVQRVVKAPATAFSPRPKVDSQVVLLQPYTDGPRVNVGDEETFERVVRAGFEQRRKVLKNALGASFESAAVERALRESGIDGGRRGETLSLEEFARLSSFLEVYAGAS